MQNIFKSWAIWKRLFLNKKIEISTNVQYGITFSWFTCFSELFPSVFYSAFNVFSWTCSLISLLIHFKALHYNLFRLSVLGSSSQWYTDQLLFSHPRQEPIRMATIYSKINFVWGRICSEISKSEIFWAVLSLTSFELRI